MIVEPDDPTGDWTAPGVYLTEPGVFRIPLALPQDGLRAVNVYALQHGDELVMIDSGWALELARERLTAALAAIGAGLGDIQRFLITHIHRDHYTQASVLRREFGSRIALGRGEQPSMDFIHSPSRMVFAAQLDRLIRAGSDEIVARLRALQPPVDDLDLYELPDDWLDDRSLVDLDGRKLCAVATPGHTNGHVVFRDDDAGLLFAGDHVLPHITPSIGFEPVPGEQPLASFLGSLRLLLDMPDARLLPAHGPVAGSVHTRIDELLVHHDDRLAAMREIVLAGSSTAVEVAAAVPWTKRRTPWAELDLYNQMLAVLETTYHLDLLVTQRRLAAEECAGVAYYAAAG